MPLLLPPASISSGIHILLLTLIENGQERGSSATPLLGATLLEASSVSTPQGTLTQIGQKAIAKHPGPGPGLPSPSVAPFKICSFLRQESASLLLACSPDPSIEISGPLTPRARRGAASSVTKHLSGFFLPLQCLMTFLGKRVTRAG